MGDNTNTTNVDYDAILKNGEISNKTDIWRDITGKPTRLHLEDNTKQLEGTVSLKTLAENGSPVIQGGKSHHDHLTLKVKDVNQYIVEQGGLGRKSGRVIDQISGDIVLQTASVEKITIQDPSNALDHNLPHAKGAHSKAMKQVTPSH